MEKQAKSPKVTMPLGAYFLRFGKVVRIPTGYELLKMNLDRKKIKVELPFLSEEFTFFG